jgi:hypothetical protein
MVMLAFRRNGRGDEGVVKAAMNDLDVKRLWLLVAVCEHQNIKRAAEQEHIEPSAISKRIALLEGAASPDAVF